MSLGDFYPATKTECTHVEEDMETEDEGRQQGELREGWRVRGDTQVNVMNMIALCETVAVKLGDYSI